MRQKERNLLFLLTSKSLEVVDIVGYKHIHIPFTDDHIKNQEVVDKERLFFLVRDRLEKESMQQRRGVLFIGDDLLLQTHYSHEDKEKQKKQAFLQSIPFEEEKMAMRELRTTENIRIFVTNRELYSVIIHAAEKATVFLVNVLPWNVLGMSETSALTLDRAKEALADYQDSEELYNFFPTQGNGHTQGTNNINSMKKIIVLVVVVGVVAGLVFFGFQKAQRFFSGEELSAVPSGSTTQVAPTVAVSPTPSPVPKKVSELTVKIINGTGMVGQAGKMKKALDAISFKSIDTANADPADKAAKALVTFTSSVDADTQKKVSDSVTRLFTDPQIKTVSSAEADIVITTGVEK